MKPIYKRNTVYHLIDSPRVWTAKGCNSWMLYNQGNVNITINNVLVLRPGQFLSGPVENPEIADYSAIDVQFDLINDPAVVQPDTGPYPIPKEITEATPTPAKDFRLIVIESYLTLM